MFKKIFSFEGRIRRTEYGLSMLGYVTFSQLIEASMVNMGEGVLLLLLLYIPMLWFLWAQGAKRCHDRGNSGWYQLIPFYGFWMIFAEGEKGPNEYGLDPKSKVLDSDIV